MVIQNLVDFPACVVSQGFVGEGIAFTSHDILLKLVVPDPPIISNKPFAGSSKFLRGKILNLAF